MSVESAPVPFWLVWSPDGFSPPRYRHNSEAAACNEASRLAAENPGKEFFAVRPVSRSVTPRSPMIVTRFDDEPAGDGMPF